MFYSLYQLYQLSNSSNNFNSQNQYYFHFPALTEPNSFVMFSAYQKLLHQHPLITKSITCGILFSLGDCATQHFVHKNEQFNFKRNISFMTVGLCYTAPMLHFWHSKMIPIITNKLFSDTTSKILRVGTLVAMDQLLFVPVLISGFFIAKSLTESFSVKGFQDGLKNRRAKMWETLQCNWMIWPAATAINFWYIPIHYRVLFSNFIGFFWNIILSYIAYDQKIDEENGKKVVRNKLLN